MLWIQRTYLTLLFYAPFSISFSVFMRVYHPQLRQLARMQKGQQLLRMPDGSKVAETDALVALQAAMEVLKPTTAGRPRMAVAERAHTRGPPVSLAVPPAGP